MSGLEKKPILRDRSTQSWPTTTEEQERWQERFLHQFNQQSTAFDGKEGLSLGQSSTRYLGEEESRTGNYNSNDSNINPNLTAGPKTEHIGVVSDNEGIIAQAQNPWPSSALLQLPNSEHNYAKRPRQSGSNYLPGNSHHSFQSNFINTMSSGSGANFPGPMFRQSKVESPQQQQRYTHSPYSLHSAGTVISPYQNPRNETPAPPPSPPPDPRSLQSLREAIQLAVGRLFREPEMHTEHMPMQLQNLLEYSDATPSVTVEMEGRSICQRIFLEEHSCYESFAQALREMFVVNILALDGQEADLINSRDYCNLSNAIPGHFIAYEDKEGDLLLAGDLSWKDFVRAAKKIRILPAKNRQGRVRKRES